MIRLFDRNETNFNHNETTLADVLSAKVIEEGNGMFEVEIEHPRNEFAKTLTAGKVVKVPTARGDQLFRIYKPVKNLTRYKLYARHIFYDLAKNFIEDIRPTNKGGMAAIHDILTAAQYEHPFIGTSNISDIGTAYYVRMNPIQAMMSADNSFLDTWGGELVRDNFTFSINAAGGTDRGYEIRIGKNLTGIDVTMDETAVYTRLYPTVVIADNVVTTLPEKYVDSPLIDAYEYPKIIEERISLTDDEKGWPIEDIYTLMRNHCADLYASEIDKPVINYKVDFVELSKTEQYKELQILEQLDLYDTVTIRVAELDIDIKAKVVKTTYDGLKERYISMELGSFKENMASQTKNTLAQTDKKINAATSNLQQAFDKAQAMITGNLGGYKIDRYNAEGLPYETLWMDTPDINTAVNVIRINQQGIGFSQSGYNGPFEVAITIDGHMVADFIDTGTLSADLVRTGTVTGLNMEINLDGGEQIFTDPSTLLKLSMKQGMIYFEDAAGQKRYLKYNAEGLITEPDPENTGTSLNSSFILRGGIGSDKYIDFSDKDFDTGILSNHQRITARNAIMYFQTIDRVHIVHDSDLSFAPIAASGFEVGSSEDFKQNIVTTEISALEKINTLSVVEYDLNHNVDTGVENKQLGFIAENSPDIAGSDGKSIDLYRAIALNTKAIQELYQEKETLKQELADLKTLLTEKGVI